MMSAFDHVSSHFTLEQLSEGVYAAIHTDGGAAICNAGLIDLGGLVVVFDTFLTPQAALDLRRFSYSTFGIAPQLVINSHYHNDHIWGNQVFARDAQIITSADTRRLIETEGQTELEWYKANSEQQLALMITRLQDANGKQERQALKGMLGYYQGLVEALPTLRVCKADITFKGSLSLHGDAKTAELIAFEGAHTASDTVLLLPSDGILFMGDILFVRSHPYLSEGDPKKLIDALRTLNHFDANSYIPGHGGIGNHEDVALLIEYVEYCMDSAKQNIEEGKTSEDLLKCQIPEKFMSWQMPHMFQSNLKSIRDRIS